LGAAIVNLCTAGGFSQPRVELPAPHILRRYCHGWTSSAPALQTTNVVDAIELVHGIEWFLV
jgi:hypothetical protein